MNMKSTVRRRRSAVDTALRNFKLTLEYDGTDFKGWQLQSQGERTIQGELKKVLLQIFKANVTVIASGRTDAGVHALGQVVNFKVTTRMAPLEIKKALNALLPADIAVVDIKEVDLKFHAILDVKSKTYRYVILNRDYPSAIQRNRCHFFWHSLDVARMKAEAKLLLGKRDFKSFEASDPVRRKHSTVRTIKKILVRKEGPWITIDIQADGFLYKMVRNIVGTLLEAGRGRLAKGGIKHVLKKKDRTHAGETAVPQGLYLLEVKY
jgi:tRNA pseudouridine38-40 synthase